jgi:hypothetical protein
MREVTLDLSSEYPTVEVLGHRHVIERIEPGSFMDVSPYLQAEFTAGGGYYAPARLRLDITYDGWYEKSVDIDVAIAPEIVSEPLELAVLDGKTASFEVFRQSGNQGGGSSVERTVTEGTGNGNGVLEPGEEATVWVKMAQGMDPFDKNNWQRCKVRGDSPYLTVVGDIQEEKQLEWTGAMNRTSVIRLSAGTPSGTEIPVLLENETWSYHYTPDVRYGPEKLYQALQLHTFHLHRHVFRVP